jgi:hypothetical protein
MAGQSTTKNTRQSVQAASQLKTEPYQLFNRGIIMKDYKTVPRKGMVEENLVVWSIRLPPSQIEQVKKAARKRKMTPSDLVRQILDNALI